MSNPIKGMIAVTSDYGIGKTTFALECGYLPKDITLIKDDVKETGFEEQFNQYVDLVSMSAGMQLLDFHNECIKMIDKLKHTKVIIWDTWTQFSETFQPYIIENMIKFRTKKQYSGPLEVVGGKIWKDSYRYEGAVISALKSKCDLLILTFHLKSLYVEKTAIPNGYRPEYSKAISKYADLCIWLTPNPNSQVPIGLVMKNISEKRIVDNKIRATQILPARLEICNWDEILKYWNNPIGNRTPEDHEKPNNFELSMIEGTLTPENKQMYQNSIDMAKIQNETENKEQDAAIKKFLTSLGDDTRPPIKLAKVRAAIEAGEITYDGEISMAKITELS